MDSAWVKAIKHENVAEIQRLLTAGADPSIDNNRAIQWASQDGHSEVVQLLLADPRVDPTVNNDFPIRFAAHNGHLGVTRLLLQDPRVDPAALNNYAIRYATRNGHLDMVRLLLADPRVDPMADSNFAIRFAVRNGHSDMVRLLGTVAGLLSATTDYFLQQNLWYRLRQMAVMTEWLPESDVNLMMWGAKIGSSNLVQTLIERGEGDPSDDGDAAIQTAAACGRLEVVRLLLNDPRVNPTAGDNFAIRYAARNGHLEVTRLLLADPRVDPSARDNCAIRWASRNNHPEVVQFLATIPGILSAAVDYYLERNQWDCLRNLAMMIGCLSESNEDLMVWGAAIGSLNLVQTLIEKGVDPTYADNLAIKAACQYDQKEIVKYLLGRLGPEGLFNL